MPTTNILHKCHIYDTYANYFMCRYETTVSVYILPSKLMQSTAWPETVITMHFILLAYAPEQICLSHGTCMSHHTATVVCIWTPHYYPNLYYPWYCHICGSNRYVPQMPYMYHICQLVHVQIWDNYISGHDWCEVTAVTCMMRSTGIHTIYIISICSKTNMPAKMQTYDPLHFYCILHIEPILLHILIKRQQIHLLLTMVWPYMYQQQMCSWNATSMLHTNVFNMHLRGKYANICHIWSCSHQWYNQNYCTQVMLDNDNDIHRNNDDADDTTAPLHKLSWPLAKSANKLNVG